MPADVLSRYGAPLHAAQRVGWGAAGKWACQIDGVLLAGCEEMSARSGVGHEIPGEAGHEDHARSKKGKLIVLIDGPNFSTHRCRPWPPGGLTNRSPALSASRPACGLRSACLRPRAGFCPPASCQRPVELAAAVKSNARTRPLPLSTCGDRPCCHPRLSFHSAFPHGPHGRTRAKFPASRAEIIAALNYQRIPNWL
eukprot:365129-Chlamydomonas_euryale.AAC.8